MAGRLVAGMDLGSTGMKLLVLDEDGAELVVEEVPTPWRAGPGGTADLPPERLVAAVEQLLDVASRRLAALTDAPVAALAIAGMGETGMVVDDAAAARRPRVRVVRPARRASRWPPSPPRSAPSSPGAPAFRSGRRRPWPSSPTCATRAWSWTACAGSTCPSSS